LKLSWGILISWWNRYQGRQAGDGFQYREHGIFSGLPELILDRM
jgi:hypothetical protein